MLSWGIVLACHAAVKNKEGLYAARFFLGMMEAGMFPGLAAQLCSWVRTTFPTEIIFSEYEWADRSKE